MSLNFLSINTVNQSRITILLRMSQKSSKVSVKKQLRAVSGQSTSSNSNVSVRMFTDIQTLNFRIEINLLNISDQYGIGRRINEYQPV